MPVGRASDSMMAPTQSYSFYWSWPELFRQLLGPPGFNFTSDFQLCCLALQRSTVTEHVVSVKSSSLNIHGTFTFRDLFSLRDDSLTS